MSNNWCALEGRGVTFGQGRCVLCQLQQLSLQRTTLGAAVATGMQRPENPAPRAPEGG